MIQATKRGAGRPKGSKNKPKGNKTKVTEKHSMETLNKSSSTINEDFSWREDWDGESKEHLAHLALKAYCTCSPVIVFEEGDLVSNDGAIELVYEDVCFKQVVPEMRSELLKNGKIVNKEGVTAQINIDTMNLNKEVIKELIQTGDVSDMAVKETLGNIVVKLSKTRDYKTYDLSFLASLGLTDFYFHVREDQKSMHRLEMELVDSLYQKSTPVVQMDEENFG